MTVVRLWRVVFAGLALVWSLAAPAEVAVPPLTARVIDQTGTLDAVEKSALERRLAAFEAKKGSQIAVLVVPTTEPETIEQYAIRVAEAWKLGREGVDDGALLLVAKNDRAVRIEVGYGLEGALNDATCKRIISEIIVPRFRDGDFYGGINAGVERMIGVIEGEPLPAPAPRHAPSGGGLGQLFPVLLILVIVGGSVLRAMLGRGLGAMVTGGAAGFVAWLVSGALFIGLVAGLIAFVFTLAGGGPGGPRFPGPGMGGFGSGGFRGGGFGGGGFSGGGGGFGGGGASGRW